MGCTNTVERQRSSHLVTTVGFRCKQHRICISSSTFEYVDEWANLLWYEGEDRELLNRILGEKRESRMARERSEDALTWNVFRYMERGAVLEHLHRIRARMLRINEVLAARYMDGE